MEVCGGHTHAIAKHGLEDLLPPGSSTCTARAARSASSRWAAWTTRSPWPSGRGEFATFGDMLRVPGHGEACSRRRREARTCGWSTRRSTPSTRARPSPTARSSSSRSASRRPRRRRRSRCTRPRAAVAELLGLLQPRDDRPAAPGDPRHTGYRIDAFIAPGHVSTVIGTAPYAFIPAITASRSSSRLRAARHPPVDGDDLRQRAEGRCEVENQYTRVVRPEGNPQAIAAIAETMELRETFEWRGLGVIARSALQLRPDSPSGTRRTGLNCRAAVQIRRPASAAGARRRDQALGVQGVRHACTPERPFGTCMVSDRGRVRGVLRLRPARGVTRGGGLVTLADGSGGKATRRLVEGLFVQELSNPLLDELGEPPSPTGSRSRPTRSSSSRFSSRAVTSASSRSTGRSMTSPSPAPSRAGSALGS